MNLCQCDFDPYPEGDPDFGEESFHFRRVCSCGHIWFSLHCRHDGVQSACPSCGQKPEPEPEDAEVVP